MPQPLVSILMITYNHKPYICKAIECVLAQKTDLPFELVIGEDCSTDGTRDIVFDYQKQYPDVIRVITSEKNVGAKQNAWRTLNACRGKYIAYCEGDDFWHRDDKLQMQVDFLESHPDYGLVCSDYDHLVIDGMRKIIAFQKNSQHTIVKIPQINDILKGEAGILTCTVLARRDLIVQIKKADPYLHMSEQFKMGDTQLWAELSMIAKIHYMAESLATHNILDESATQSTDINKVLQFWISNSEMALYLCNKHGLSEQVKKAHEKNWRRKSLQLAFNQRRIDKANEVKSKHPDLSIKDLVWYWGTIYSLMRPVVLFIKKFMNFIEENRFKFNFGNAKSRL